MKNGQYIRIRLYYITTGFKENMKAIRPEFVGIVGSTL